MAQASQQASSSSHSNIPTLLSHFQALAQPSLGLPPAYLHPFAPLPGAGWPGSHSFHGKGKGRAAQQDSPSIQSQLEMVREMKRNVEQAKAVLSKSNRDGDWGKLPRALKEVVSHQSVLQPLSASLSQSFSGYSGSSHPLIPSSRVSLPPVQLLPALAQAQNIETYHEDSQFGLLKATITLAGNCFVIDIDLETDAAADEEDGSGTVPPTPSLSAVPNMLSGPSTGSIGRTETTRGTVRLSKLAVSYVTPEGGMEASSHIEGVCKSAIEDYLGVWNAAPEGLLEEKKRAETMEQRIRTLEALLAEMKALDGSVPVQGKEPEQISGFAALERVVKRIQRMMEERLVYPGASSTICPSFRLFPQNKSDTQVDNPTFRMRPPRAGEHIPLAAAEFPEGDSSGSAVASELAGPWLLELLPQAGSGGLVVRRDWLGGALGVDSPWDGGVKVENLLFKPDNGVSPVNPFPYQAQFITKPEPVNGRESLEQHWSLASPGPDGYLLGRLALPRSDEDLNRLIRAIRRQIILNRLFASVFSADTLADPSIAEVEMDEDEELEDLLSVPTAIPIDVNLAKSSIVLTSPLPHQVRPGATLHLTVTFDESGVGIQVLSQVTGLGEEGADLERAVQLALQGLVMSDLVEIYRRADHALKPAAPSTA